MPHRGKSESPQRPKWLLRDAAAVGISKDSITLGEATEAIYPYGTAIKKAAEEGLHLSSVMLAELQGANLHRDVVFHKLRTRVQTLIKRPEFKDQIERSLHGGVRFCTPALVRAAIESLPLKGVSPETRTAWEKAALGILGITDEIAGISIGSEGRATALHQRYLAKRETITRGVPEGFEILGYVSRIMDPNYHSHDGTGSHLERLAERDDFPKEALEALKASEATQLSFDSAALRRLSQLVGRLKNRDVIQPVQSDHHRTVWFYNLEDMQRIVTEYIDTLKPKWGINDEVKAVWKEAVLLQLRQDLSPRTSSES